MKNISEIEGVVLEQALPDRRKAEHLIGQAVEVVNTIFAREGLAQGLPMGLALSSSLQTVTNLLHSALAKCTLAHPPEDIEMKLNGNMDLVLRCYHDPYHEWDASGKKK
ncbi:MAG: hypothetical protein R3B95_21380 [Nitrospirales bacterium]|nr:hypothetical protein [Nitrospirales bacterium]